MYVHLYMIRRMNRRRCTLESGVQLFACVCVCVCSMHVCTCVCVCASVCVYVYRMTSPSWRTE